MVHGLSIDESWYKKTVAFNMKHKQSYFLSYNPDFELVVVTKSLMKDHAVFGVVGYALKSKSLMTLSTCEQVIFFLDL